MRGIAGIWSHPLLRAALGLAALALLSLAVTRVALDRRRAPERCPAGMSALGARCCGADQRLVNGACAGRASRCAVTQELDDSGQCVARFGVVSFAGGVLEIGATDWDGASGGVRFPRTDVAPFRLDVSEVTQQRFRACPSCVEACAGCSEPGAEPGLPVVNIEPEGAARFCETQRGRLPTAAEWVWAATSGSARRYPWGNSGLVCRRAAFGLERGPCADSGGPELAGARPDGATPEGVFDLAGNVAEWTLESSGQFSARGGSFRSSSAAQLKSWASLPDRHKALYIGFRCAYPP